jgi:hypothetical protein
MSQFLDCLGEDEIISILSRALPALAPDGQIEEDRRAQRHRDHRWEGVSVHG